jgi:hypothetical protein
MLSLSFLLLWIAQAPELQFEAPPEMAATKTRLESLTRLDEVARLVGLKDPGAPISIELATEASDLGRSTEPWIAGFARGEAVVIFPSRSHSYPHQTLDDVLRHEVAHVLIWRASRGQPVPRWFNEGLATAAERSRGVGDHTQFLLYHAFRSRLSFDGIDRLFDGGPYDQERAYLLSGTLVWDLLRKHGETAGGRILEQVGRGVSFSTAFRDVTGQSLNEAETEFWNREHIWTAWLGIVFSQETLWMTITLLAILAIWRVRKRNAKIRKRWEEEDGDDPEDGIKTYHRTGSGDGTDF